MIDVHCHLTDEEYEKVGGIKEILFHAKQVGVSRIICSGYDLDTSVKSSKICEEEDGVYFCAGFHPSELDKYVEGDFDRLKALCEHEKCVAVGEIGLDYHYDDNPPKDVQKQCFINQARQRFQAVL